MEMRRRRPFFHLRIALVALGSLLTLVAAVLACTSTNMQAKDQPIWICPTATLDPQCFVTPDGTGTPPPPPQGSCTYETPYEKTSDFPLGRMVIVGAVGGYGMGVWASMDHVQTHGPFDYTDKTTGAISKVWVVSWTVSVTNGSLSNDYEFYPLSQVYVLDVYDENHQLKRGAWPISAEATDLIHIPRLSIDDGSTFLAHGKLEPMFPWPFTPGDGRSYDVAAIVPSPDVWRFALIFDPLDTQKVGEMTEKNSLGSNVAVWINAYDHVCRYDDIIPQQGQFTGFKPGGPAQPGIFVAGYLLARYPVSSGWTIFRGFGCVKDWTGFKAPGCSGDTPWFHNGVDFDKPKGSAYYDTLPLAGSVLYAGEDTGQAHCENMKGSEPPHVGYGNYVKHTVTEQGHTVVIWGGHLSAISVASNSPTQPGQALGAVGSTGCSSGPHVHFAVSVDGRFVDPLPLIPPGAP